MSRVTDALLSSKAFSKGHTQPMLDLTYGGQMGYSPDLAQWVSNQAYVRRHVFALVIEAPKFFQYMPDPQVWTSNFKALIERHPRTIEGLNSGLTVSVEETPVGGAGETHQVVTDVKRAKSEPVFGWDEKYGLPISTFLQNWITYGMMDPDSKVANVGTLSGNRPTDMLSDQYAATVLFIEPDPTHRKVVKAWLCANIFPQGTGDIVGSRDVGSAMQLQQLSVTFSAITQVGVGVDAFAQKLMDNINISNANPYLRPAFINDISADVSAVTSGYGAQVSAMAANAINPA